MRFISKTRLYAANGQVFGQREGDYIVSSLGQHSLYERFFAGYSLLKHSLGPILCSASSLFEIKREKDLFLSFIEDEELKDLLSQVLSWPDHDILLIPRYTFNSQLKFVLKNWTWLEQYNLSEIRSVVDDNVEIEEEEHFDLRLHYVPYFVSSPSMIDSSLWDKFKSSPDTFLDDLESNDWEGIYDPDTVQLPQPVLDNSEEGMVYIAGRIEDKSLRTWRDVQNRILYVALGHLYDVPWRRIVDTVRTTRLFSLIAPHKALRNRIKDLILHGPNLNSIAEEDVGKILSELDEEIENHK